MTAPVRQLQVGALAEFIAAQAAAGLAAPVLLDVREAWEVHTAALAVPGLRTLHIAMNSLPTRLAELDPMQPVIALCHHGMRSLQCVAFLQHQGFGHAYNLAGGIDAWSREVDATVPRY